MIKIVKKIVFEPLFHFLLLGFILYIFYSMTSDTEVEDKKIIKISSYEIGQIRSNYKKEYKKDINEEYLNALIAKKQYEKLLLNEAYSLGLEKQDKEISKRLLKQMHFIMTNSSEIIEPSEEELYRYYIKNIDDYSVVNTLSFSHVYFSNPKDKKIDDTFKLLSIASVDADKAAYFGKEFGRANYVKNLKFKEIEAIFGKYFTNKLFNLKQGLWHKQIHSKHGVHLVYITDKNVADAYQFDEVQERVYNDFMNERRRAQENRSYKSISSQYSLRVE